MIKKNDRSKFVAEAIYTNTLEGKRVSDFFLEEASRYCNDEIDLAEFDCRLCKHYGISPSQLERQPPMSFVDPYIDTETGLLINSIGAKT